MIKKHYDIIIVGGGPSGSAASIFLKKHNPSVNICIIDKATFPRKKSCGDGLSPGVADIIKEAGMNMFFAEKTPISIFQLVCPGVIDLKYDMKNMGSISNAGYVFPREFFDDQLIKHAATVGVDIFENHEIINITEAGTFSTDISCTHAGNTIVFNSKLVIGADGVHSQVRKYLHVAPNSNKHMGIALRYYCTIKQPAEPYLRIDILKSLKNSYGWVFPVSATTANIGIGVDMDVHKKKNINLNTELDKYLLFLREDFQPEIIGGTRSGYPLPYGSELPKLVYNNKVLIGDAASMINPLTGEGIYYGMQAGKMLAEHIAVNFNATDTLQQSLAAFEEAFTGNYKNHYQFNLTIKKVLASPFAGFFLKRMAKDQQRLNKVMGIILGNTSKIDLKDFSLKNFYRIKSYI
ncbi:MAG: geranylgeranyl reductase family protein [Agriterribacter sp.]